MLMAQREIGRGRASVQTMELLYLMLLQKKQADQAPKFASMGVCACGKGFQRLNRGGGRRRVWCSQACAQKAYRVRKLQRAVHSVMTEGMQDDPFPDRGFWPE
jgi:hypothetical protein